MRVVELVEGMGVARGLGSVWYGDCDSSKGRGTDGLVDTIAV